jgi:hypothetical protein
MNEVFTHAAFGQSQNLTPPLQKRLDAPVNANLRSAGDKHPPKPSAPYSIYDKVELETRAVRLRIFPTPRNFIFFVNY